MQATNWAGRAYAYRVPLNPFTGDMRPWSTLVRRSRVRAGDHLLLSEAEWKVTAIEVTPDDGTPAAVRGWKGPAPLWAGALILRRATSS